MDVAGIGALNMDKIYRVPRIAREGEELPVIEVYEASGGSAANTIVALSRMGISTGFIGVVGKDSEGRKILRDMVKEGVNTECMEKFGGHTGVIIVLVDNNGERTMYAYPGVNNLFEIKDSMLRCAENAKYLHVSSFVGEKSFLSQLDLIQNLKNKISFAPGMLYTKYKNLSELRDFISKSKVIFLNREEASYLTGKQYENGARDLIMMGAEIVAVTLGRDGCYIRTGDKEIRVEAENVRVVDTTGAGDAFAAGFLYGLVRGYEPETCARLGNFTAARCTEHLGARDGLPFKEAVEEFITRL
ncbi:MAG TPA: carbohydrate kinase family protein [Euryarchaeota archaeon]|nr:putative sugar kinase YdjH [archaeon BMS3Bbin15]HDL14608.1 carbohydrate kinase family protein [Euryarchaeota archaeon]